MTQSVSIICNSSDGFVNKFNSMDTTNVQLYIGTEPGADTDMRTWIPFTCSLQRGQIITSATLRLVGASTGSSDGGETIRVAMEASDNANNPASGADMRGRSITSATVTVSLAQYVASTVYTYDVTAALQEVVNRAGYVQGNQVAVIMDDPGTVGNKVRRAHSYEAGSNRPQLDIVVPDYVPRGGGVV